MNEQEKTTTMRVRRWACTHDWQGRGRDGIRLREGKILDARSFDIDSLIALGAPLIEVDPVEVLSPAPRPLTTEEQRIHDGVRQAQLVIEAVEAEEPPPRIPPAPMKVRRFVIVRDKVLPNGMLAREGKLLDERSFDIDKMRQLGVPLQEIAPVLIDADGREIKEQINAADAAPQVSE